MCFSSCHAYSLWWIYYRKPMRTTCRLVKLNILPFIEPIRKSVKKNSLIWKFLDTTLSKPSNDWTKKWRFHYLNQSDTMASSAQGVNLRHMGSWFQMGSPCTSFSKMYKMYFTVLWIVCSCLITNIQRVSKFSSLWHSMQYPISSNVPSAVMSHESNALSVSACLCVTIVHVGPHLHESIENINNWCRHGKSITCMWCHYRNLGEIV